MTAPDADRGCTPYCDGPCADECVRRQADADRMGAWRDEVAGVLGEHRATPIVDDGILIGYGCPLPCEWGSEGGYDPDAHRDHLAEALLPLLARIDRDARREAADRYLTVAAQAVRLAYDEPERLSDHLIFVARRLKALVDEDRAKAPEAKP